MANIVLKLLVPHAIEDHSRTSDTTMRLMNSKMLFHGIVHHARGMRQEYGGTAYLRISRMLVVHPLHLQHLLLNEDSN